MKIIKNIFSGEFIFALYIIAGSFKSIVNIPFIDETLLLLFITFIIGMKNFIKNKMLFPKKLLIPSLLFSIIMVISLLSLMYTSSIIYAPIKLLRFCIIGGWCFFGVFFIFKNENSIKKFLFGILTVSIIMAISVLLQGQNSNLGFQSTFGSNYVTLARNSAMGSLILIVYYIYAKKNKITKYIALLLAMILFIPLIQSGARFPILILILTLSIIPFSLIRFRNNTIFFSAKFIPLAFTFIVLIISIVFLIQKGYANTLIYRMEVSLENKGGGASIEGRTSRFKTAWDMSEDSYFLGKGLGSFSLYYSGMDKEDYPHSIYLELLSELGIISLLVFIFLLFIVFLRGWKNYKDIGLNALNTSIFMLFLFWLINSFGSSSLIDDKVFYTMIAIIISLPIISKNNLELQKVKLE